MYIRDDEGHYVLAKTEWMTPLLDVDLGKALGLLSAMYWVRDLQLGIMDFELDSNTVFRFIRRQAKEVAHNFARVASRHASFHIHIMIQSCISTIIMKEMVHKDFLMHHNRTRITTIAELCVTLALLWLI
ncbi:hypothetical protein MTR_5g091440 [Medicago truncatula]|uniref:RNase H type-1 domain-containing protein n=1 Tax=Medicago truncatula TaxID=3880 RepID=G7KD58_MEDTR|nr:hypothetical protein MTR_5g091440 [Medicago truncatula]